MNLAQGWPFEQLSRYLLARILEGYTPDRSRVTRALAILDGDPADDFEELAGELHPSRPVPAAQDVVGPPVDFDPIEWACYRDDASCEVLEAFQPSAADWQDYNAWSSQLEVERALQEAHQIAEWQDRLEQSH